MSSSSPNTHKNSGIKPPAVDAVFIDDTREVTVRDHSELVRNVMALHGSSKPEAERYIHETGQETVERELQARGQQSTRWGGA